MIRQAIHRIAQQAASGPAIFRAPITPFLERFTAGEQIDVALQIAEDLTNEGFSVSLERAAPMLDSSLDIPALLTDLDAALAGIAALGLGPVTEISVFAHALGLSGDLDISIVEERLIPIIELAQGHEVTVMLGAGAPDKISANLELARRIRTAGYPLGITLQASLRRTQRDCQDFGDGPVRLVKGAYHVSGGAVFTSAAEVDKSFVRCAKTLIQGDAPISFATHDDRIIQILQQLLKDYHRDNAEFAFYLGRHTGMSEQLLRQGWPVRVYIPFGPEWFTRLVDAFAERPATLASALRSVVTGG
jgi:proline dehydrogenase